MQQPSNVRRSRSDICMVTLGRARPLAAATTGVDGLEAIIPVARAWIAREGDNRLDPTPYPDYPNPAAAPVELVVHPGGATAGGLTSLALPVAGEETLVDAGSTACNAGTLATQESDNRLLYVTAELSEAVHISGSG